MVEERRSKRAAAKPVLTNWLGDEASRDARRLFAAHEHRQLRHAGRGDRRLHAARPLCPRAGRADAHAALDCRRTSASRPQRRRNDRGRPGEPAARRCRKSKRRPCSPATASRSCRLRSRASRRRGRRACRALDRLAWRVRGEDPVRRHLAQVGRGWRAPGAGAPGGGRARRAGHAGARRAPQAARRRLKGFTVQPMIRRPERHGADRSACRSIRPSGR